MTVVLDSNIFFSALISPYGPPAKIIDAWSRNRFDVATCLQQMEEIRQASRHPKFRMMFKPHRVGMLLHSLQASQVLHGFAKIYSVEDPADSYLLNLAVAAKAHYLISGDRKSGIFEKSKVRTTRTLTAEGFVRTVLR